MCPCSGEYVWCVCVWMCNLQVCVGVGGGGVMCG